MIQTHDTQSLLAEFKTLLLNEKDALIHNRGKEIQQIVAGKEGFAEQLAQLDLSDAKRKDMQPLLQEIRQLQETNLLLTQQSLAFVDRFMDAIHTEVKQRSVTYSKKGSYGGSNHTAFLDQSV